MPNIYLSHKLEQLNESFLSITDNLFNLGFVLTNEFYMCQGYIFSLITLSSILHIWFAFLSFLLFIKLWYILLIELWRLVSYYVLTLITFYLYNLNGLLNVNFLSLYLSRLKSILPLLCSKNDNLYPLFSLSCSVK